MSKPSEEQIRLLGEQHKAALNYPPAFDMERWMNTWKHPATKSYNMADEYTIWYFLDKDEEREFTEILGFEINGRLLTDKQLAAEGFAAIDDQTLDELLELKPDWYPTE